MSVDETLPQAPVDLDDPEAMRNLDPGNMLGMTLGFPHQCRRGLEMAAGFDPASLSGNISNIVVSGLGASAIGGDMLRSVFESEMSVPVVVNRDYEAPGFVNRSTLFIAVSYSGNAQETLSAYRHAQERGAKVVCITSGGILGEWAEKENVPWIQIPGGQPSHSAIGFLFMPMMVILHRLGLLADKTGDLEEAIGLLENMRGALAPNVPVSDNQAKLLARRLYRKLIIIYGSQGYKGVAAQRWKSQLNENSKIHAFSSVFPEMNHNEILGWRLSLLQADNLAVVLIRDPDDSIRTKTRIEVTKTIIFGKAEIYEVWTEGKSRLARLLTGIYLGDFVSVYLAFLNSIDPADTAAIDLLKEKLTGLE